MFGKSNSHFSLSLFVSFNASEAPLNFSLFVCAFLADSSIEELSELSSDNTLKNCSSCVVCSTSSSSSWLNSSSTSLP
jgi:hypothetical protein